MQQEAGLVDAVNQAKFGPMGVQHVGHAAEFSFRFKFMTYALLSRGSLFLCLTRRMCKAPSLPPSLVPSLVPFLVAEL